MNKFFTLLLPLTLLGVEIEITHPKVSFFHGAKKEYTLTSQHYINRFKSSDLGSFLLNKEKYMLSHNYYKNGFFKTNTLALSFQKAYKLSTKVYLYNIKGNYRNYFITAQKATYCKNELLLYKCELKSPKKIIRRKYYKLKLN